MKLALIGAAALAAAAFATPVLAQTVAVGNPYKVGGYYRDWQNGNVMVSYLTTEPNAHHYHGGPKSND